ncbi:MAG: ZinT/AdcA family metal-binding protein [Litorilinea sp.]
MTDPSREIAQIVVGDEATPDTESDHAAHAHSEQAAFTDLSAWEGSWISADAFLSDPAVEAVYAAIDAVAGQGAGAGQRLLETMLRTDFVTVEVAGNTVVYGDGTASFTCEYTYAGPREAWFGEHTFIWHQAELSTGDDGCEAYRYLLLTESHAGDAGDIVHWHARYGDTSFEQVSNDSALELWWPSIMPSETTAQDLADGWIGNADAFAAMLVTEPAEAPETQSGPATLVVADAREGGLYAYSIPDWQPVAEFPDLQLADHPGYLVLPDGRVLFTTPDSEFIVLSLAGDEAGVAARVALPGGAIHFAVDPTLAYAVVSTMRDEAAGIGENTLTQIELATYTATSIPVTSGEPGVLVTEQAVLHRDGGEIGRLEAFPMANFATQDGTAASYVDIGAYGHGEGLVNGHAYVATDDGIDVVHIDGTELTHETVIPWNVSGREGGRGYYMRADAHGNLWSYLRIVQNPAADASWANWQDWGNDAYLINTVDNEATRFDLGPGLVYRMSLSQSYALYSRLHPDGDQAILVDAEPTSATFAEIVATIDLPATSDAPVAGVAPWDAAGQRITAITPDGKWGFVSGGGDGTVHVIDTTTRAIVGQIDVPAPLVGGGYLLVVQPGQPVLDSLGR